jgi:hypothetical protein
MGSNDGAVELAVEKILVVQGRKAPKLRLVENEPKAAVKADFKVVSVTGLGSVTENALDEVMKPRTVLCVHDPKQGRTMHVAFSDASNVAAHELPVSNANMLEHIKQQQQHQSDTFEPFVAQDPIKVSLIFNKYPEDISFKGKMREIPSAYFTSYSTLVIK